MAIKQSVGKGGKNQKTDVKVVQAALNLSVSVKFKLDKKLVIDGRIGAKTNKLIELFQKDVVGLTAPDGRVDPGGKTLSTLKSSLKKGISEDSMLAIMTSGGLSNIKTYLNLFQSELSSYDINTPLRICHFLAQVGHESLSLIYSQELASGEAYEGRKDLGNTEKGDGKRFKGRGLIQLTGRDNYDKYGKHISKDLLKLGNEVIVATTPKYALGASLWFWQSKKLNKYADQDDLKRITRRVNGGYNGLADRQDYLDRAKFFLIK